MRAALFEYDDLDHGDPYDSDHEFIEFDQDDGEVDESAAMYGRLLREREAAQLHDLPLYLEDLDKDGEKEETGYRWMATGYLPPPANVAEKKRSMVRPECQKLFKTEMSSFLAFIPVRFWLAIAAYCSINAHLIMEQTSSNLICGARWEHDVTLKEVFVTVAVSGKMVLRPTPGQEIVAAWEDPAWHPYTKHIKLR